MDLYDTRNGIALCSDCHFLCCVDVVHEDGTVKHILRVSDTLKLSVERSGKWLEIDGREVRVPTDEFYLQHWPSPELFKFRNISKIKYSAIKRWQIVHLNVSVA